MYRKVQWALTYINHQEGTMIAKILYVYQDRAKQVITTIIRLAK